ncbi:nucleoside diphosphate kinase 7-like [Rhincodon typus]|uniref:nucleoside diphosphate kinase 7-like n=1 Tax=Rhincodon typus TaxID=259920 RepID=UPI00202E31C0|nr:nucleoside diphosphate kinase 7-like [Rhincodon typus]
MADMILNGLDKMDMEKMFPLDHEEQFSFIAEWYDASASLIRRYLFFFYPKDGSIEMYDIKNHRTFLKRTKYEQLRQEDLFVDSVITVYSRQLHLVSYGDQYTARKLGSKKQKTLGIIKPGSDLKFGKLIDRLYSSGLVISKAKMIDLTSLVSVIGDEDFRFGQEMEEEYEEKCFYATTKNLDSHSSPKRKQKSNSTK